MYNFTARISCPLFWFSLLYSDDYTSSIYKQDYIIVIHCETHHTGPPSVSPIIDGSGAQVIPLNVDAVLRGVRPLAVAVLPHSQLHLSQLGLETAAEHGLAPPGGDAPRAGQPPRRIRRRVEKFFGHGKAGGREGSDGSREPKKCCRRSIFIVNNHTCSLPLHPLFFLPPMSLWYSSNSG